MKKLIPALIVFALISAVAFGAWAAGTVTITKQPVSPNVYYLKFAWTSTAGGLADATFGDGATEFLSPGYCILLVTDPGATAPTANWDVTVTDPWGCDIAGGQLMNRSATITEQALAATVLQPYGERYVHGTLKLNVTNAGNATVGDVYIYIRREARRD